MAANNTSELAILDTSRLVAIAKVDSAMTSPNFDGFDPEFDNFDVVCQKEAIGSSARAMRAILNQLRARPGLVTTYAKFTNVPPEIAELKLSKGCRQLYDAGNRYLLITVPGVPHERAVGQFQTFLTLSLEAAGIVLLVVNGVSGRVEGTQSSKEPDGSWFPKSIPPGRSRTWPSVVLEVGVSESRKKLRADATWWLANSQGEVNIVILISINRTIAEVIFESVVLEQPPIYMRNGRRQYRPHTRQSIKVTRLPGGAGQPVTTVPSTSPLTITIEEIMCRPPNPTEANPVIPISLLEAIAGDIWDAQGL
ncbi:hypothetical protein PDE_02683 [Penicillium oxalicum 114-2]|uniref:Uncharacterized protein n=1 Tax=Penicillium oxalicum (strain 114-2 / CGMCC 5302) TaxID=933388 RepID=S7ZBX4_PENO1|nr:hypothetical protein PDE_02683 [Penicillium oxalicum 114-2]